MSQEKICKYTITLYVPNALSAWDRKDLESHIEAFLTASDDHGEVNVHPRYEEVDVTEDLRHLLLTKQEHCTGCGCELEDPTPTT